MGLGDVGFQSHVLFQKFPTLVAHWRTTRNMMTFEFLVTLG